MISIPVGNVDGEGLGEGGAVRGRVAIQSTRCCCKRRADKIQQVNIRPGSGGEAGDGGADLIAKLYLLQQAWHFPRHATVPRCR